MRGPASLATYVGIGMIAVGFVVIGLAWDGASELDFIQGQFPYLLSGGLGGLGLIVGGMALLAVQTVRQAGALETAQMTALTEGLAAVTTTLRERGVAAAVSQALPAPIANGGDPSPPPEPDLRWDAPELVVVGRSSYHDPSCHLVASRDDLDTMERPDAEEAGLAPCRVCKP